MMSFIRRFALLALVGFSFSAPASAATFKVSANFNSGVTFILTGRVSVLTNYLDASGGTIPQSPGSSGNTTLQDWDIKFTGPGQMFYNNSNSTSSLTSNGFTLVCSGAPECGGGTGSFSLGFSDSWNDVLSDSYPSGLGLKSTTLGSASWGSTAASVINSGQADFIPLAPSLLIFAPIGALLRRIKSSPQV